MHILIIKFNRILILSLGKRDENLNIIFENKELNYSIQKNSNKIMIIGVRKKSDSNKKIIKLV